METKIKSEEEVDAIELQHKLRADLASKISKMTPEEEIEFFKSASKKAKKRRAKY